MFKTLATAAVVVVGLTLPADAMTIKEALDEVYHHSVCALLADAEENYALAQVHGEAAEYFGEAVIEVVGEPYPEWYIEVAEGYAGRIMHTGFQIMFGNFDKDYVSFGCIDVY